MESQWTNGYHNHKINKDQYRVYDADEADKEIERLRKDLKKYGEHHHSCKFRWAYLSKDCTCGLQQALKE